MKFTFLSPYSIFYAASLLGQTIIFLMTFHWLTQNKISLSNVTKFVFYTSSLISSLILANIGWFWPRFALNVEAIEVKLPPFTRDVARMCNATMVFIFIATLVEHSFSLWYGLTVAYSCTPTKSLETYFRFNMPFIFHYTEYALWKGVLGELISLQGTFIWSYNDLLIMVISIYLTEHFIIHEKLLENASEQENFSYSELRTQYMKIVRLVELFNGQFGIYIVTSFGSNLYWICTQLFFSINKRQTRDSSINCSSDVTKTVHGTENTVYFMYSFSFLVVRTMLVLLLAARIHSTSIAPLYILFNVPTEKFNVEVERFIGQIKNLKVALSGLGFFYVTRTMILTLLGTIVTYELVLLQFNK